jgi:hypothetical protein
MLDDLFGSMLGGALGLFVGEKMLERRGRRAAAKVAKGGRATVRGFMRDSGESLARPGWVTLLGVEEMSWRERRWTRNAERIERIGVRGLQEVQLKGWFKQRTWVWDIRRADGRPAELSFQARQGRPLLDVLAPGHVAPSHSRRKT